MIIFVAISRRNVTVSGYIWAYLMKEKALDVCICYSIYTYIYMYIYGDHMIVLNEDMIEYDGAGADDEKQS